MQNACLATLHLNANVALTHFVVCTKCCKFSLHPSSSTFRSIFPYYNSFISTPHPLLICALSSRLSSLSPPHVHAGRPPPSSSATRPPPPPELPPRRDSSRRSSGAGREGATSQGRGSHNLSNDSAVTKGPSTRTNQRTNRRTNPQRSANHPISCTIRIAAYF
jgi:hypothetical protein